MPYLDDDGWHNHYLCEDDFCPWLRSEQSDEKQGEGECCEEDECSCEVVVFPDILDRADD
jgi:hypothetical protein